MLKEVGFCAREPSSIQLCFHPSGHYDNCIHGTRRPNYRGGVLQRGVQQGIRASQADPQRSTIAAESRFRSTPLWKGTAVPYKPPFRKDRRFNKIRSIDRLATMTSLSDCIMAFRILVERVLERRVCFLIPAVSCRGPYRRRRSVFPLFIGQGLRRKYRRRPLGGIMKFRLPYWCETVRDRGMCARIAGYKRFSIVRKLSWVGGSLISPPPSPLMMLWDWESIILSIFVSIKKECNYLTTSEEKSRIIYI